ncbi:MAG: Rho termination factor N-terminal domain-containing protein [Metamycoplasmataceae bacterium]
MNFLLNINEYKEKTSSQIFESEKKFRPFFIALFIALLFLFAMYLTSLILTIMNWTDPNFIQAFKDNLIANDQNNILTPSRIENIVLQTQLIQISQASILLLIITTSLVLFVKKLYDCYKEKTFSKLSIMASMVIGLIGFYVIVNLLTSFFNPRLFISWSTIDTLNIIASGSTIFIWFFISRYITLIKKISLRAEMLAKAKEQQYGLNEIIQQVNTFQTNENGEKSEENVDYEANVGNNENKEIIIEQKYESNPNALKLKNLNKTQLTQIANKLSISGIDLMTKEELIYHISIVTNDENKPKKSTTKSVKTASKKPSSKTKSKNNEEEQI